jgi:putative Flp pilus-assembly TadE/G-like protein
MFTSKLTRPRRKSRRGAIVVMVALSLGFLLAFVAIAVDGGWLLELRRKSQATADAAALAAAETLFREYPQYRGLDVKGNAANAARSIAAANGFENDGTTSVVNVRTAPEKYSGGPNLGKPIPAGVAEVVVQYNQKRYFASILGSGTLPVPARAVAAGSWKAADVAIHVLDLHRGGSLNATGESSVTVRGAKVIVNSDAYDAASSNGGVITAPSFDITGGSAVSGGKGGFNGDLNYGTPPEPDPLRNIPQPVATGGQNKVQFSNGVRTVSPGAYRGGISVSGKGSLKMEPGIYFMDGGGFNFSGQGSLNANGVMIYNAPTKSSDVVSITGTGSIIMSPPTQGTYKGLTLFQDRASSNTMTVSGGGYMDITGTFYAAGGTLKVGGGGDGRVGSQYISRFLEIVGNGGLRIDYDPEKAIPARTLHLTE